MKKLALAVATIMCAASPLAAQEAITAFLGR